VSVTVPGGGDRLANEVGVSVGEDAAAEVDEQAVAVAKIKTTMKKFLAIEINFKSKINR
jgi:hypothetical protein